MRQFPRGWRANLYPTGTAHSIVGGNSLRVADIPDADDFARAVLNRLVTRNVHRSQNIHFAVEGLARIDCSDGFALWVEDGSERPRIHFAWHIGGHADELITSLYEKRSRASGLGLNLVDD